MRASVLMTVVTLALAPTAQADFDQAVVAHAQGDYEKAVAVFLPLAETSHHPYAQYYLGIMYANGQGVKKDLKTAARWLRSAAEQGIPQAQFRLGELYAAGNGVPRDYERAYVWFSIASHFGHKAAASAQGSAVSHLSAAELREAKKLSEELIARYSQPVRP